ALRSKPGEVPHDAVWITDDAVRPARERSSLGRVAPAVNRALGIGPWATVLRMHLGQISDRSLVGMVDDVLDVLIGFFLGRATDDADGRPHLNFAPVRARESLRLRDASGTRLRRLDRIEVHVRVTDREPAAGLG